MESRLLPLQEAYLDFIAAQEGKMPDRDETLNWERMHMASCARLGYLLALERGADPDLAACACAIHDIGRVVTGRQAGHAQAGLEPARAFLAGTGLFSPDTTITRQEIMVILDQALDLPEENGLDFTDTEDIAVWALPAAARVTAAGLMTGSYGQLLPDAPCTRGEAAALVNALLTSDYI